MNVNDQERKIQIASYLTRVLESLQLPTTAQTLRQEAKIKDKRNVTDDILQIFSNQHLQERQKQHLVNQYFSIYIKRLLRENQIEEALNVFENYVPLYVKDLQPISLLFADNHKQETLNIGRMFQELADDTSMMPEKRVNCLNLGREIWFIEALNNSILTIDCKSGARVITNGTVSAQRQNLHSNLVFTLAVKNCVFATGGDDTHCRVWNQDLVLLYEIPRFQNRITSICFTQHQMAVFDNGGIIQILETVPSAITPRNALRSHRLKTVPFIEVKYLTKKRCILGCGFDQGRGRLDLLDLHRGKYTCKLSLALRIHSIQISKCQKLVFVNLSSMQIRAYSISHFQLKYKFTGYVQRKFLMRMAIGGKNKDLLAVSSEQGCVCIYNLKKKEMIGQVKCSSGKPVNCVHWMGENLFFGCDAGNLQQWSNYPLQLHFNSSTNIHNNPMLDQREQHTVSKIKEMNCLFNNGQNKHSPTSVSTGH